MKTVDESCLYLRLMATEPALEYQLTFSLGNVRPPTSVHWTIAGDIRRIKLPLKLARCSSDVRKRRPNAAPYPAKCHFF